MSLQKAEPIAERLVLFPLLHVMTFVDSKKGSKIGVYRPPLHGTTEVVQMYHM